MPKYVENLIGQVFGKLTVIKFAGYDEYGKTYWLCRCACGNVKKIRSTNLKSGASQSCGCINITHHKSDTMLYRKWANRIRPKCDNEFYEFKTFLKWAVKNGYNDFNDLMFDFEKIRKGEPYGKYNIRRK